MAVLITSFLLSSALFSLGSLYNISNCVNLAQEPQEYPTGDFYIAAALRSTADPFNKVWGCGSIQFKQHGIATVMLLATNASKGSVIPLYEHHLCIKAFQEEIVTGCDNLYVRPPWFFYIQCGYGEISALLATSEKVVSSNDSRKVLEEWVTQLDMDEEIKVDKFVYSRGSCTVEEDPNEETIKSGIGIAVALGILLIANSIIIVIKYVKSKRAPVAPII